MDDGNIVERISHIAGDMAKAGMFKSISFFFACVKLHYIVKFASCFELCFVSNYALFVNIRTLHIEQ